MEDKSKVLRPANPDPIERVDIYEMKYANRRLGRHVAHDPQSWRYPAPMAPEIVSVSHLMHDLPLNQGNLGSCTGNAAVGMLMTEPFYVHTMTKTTQFMLTEADAVDIYSKA